MASIYGFDRVIRDKGSTLLGRNNPRSSIITCAYGAARKIFREVEMLNPQGYDPVLATAVLRNLSVDDIVLVMVYRNVDADSGLRIGAFTLMLMGLKETCQIRLTNHTKT